MSNSKGVINSLELIYQEQETRIKGLEDELARVEAQLAERETQLYHIPKTIWVSKTDAKEYFVHDSKEDAQLLAYCNNTKYIFIAKRYVEV